MYDSVKRLEPTASVPLSAACAPIASSAANDSHRRIGRPRRPRGVEAMACDIERLPCPEKCAFSAQSMALAGSGVSLAASVSMRLPWPWAGRYAAHTVISR